MSRPIVHLLATCRRIELLPATLLVFESIRTGFPTAKIVVTYNENSDGYQHGWKEVRERAESAGASFQCFGPTSHAEWIRNLVIPSGPSAWICDTDVVFFDKVEDLSFHGTPMAGMHIPRFYCPYVKATTLERIHTALMWLDCNAIRNAMASEGDTFLAPEDLISPRRYWHDGERYFADTMTGLYQKVGGWLFSQEQLDAYGHAFSGTIIDKVGPAIPGLSELHEKVYQNPQILKGAWRKQLEFYQSRACNA